MITPEDLSGQERLIAYLIERIELYALSEGENSERKRLSGKIESLEKRIEDLTIYAHEKDEEIKSEIESKNYYYTLFWKIADIIHLPGSPSEQNVLDVVKALYDARNNNDNT